MPAYRIGVLVGSTRKERQSIRVARWVMRRLGQVGAEPALLDPLELGFPLFAHRPRAGHTPKMQRVSRRLQAMDGLFIVTPEYNHGYPSALKNTLDQFYDEYEKKPVAIAAVSNGPFGGSRVVEQLKPVLVELRLVPIRNSVLVQFMPDAFDEDDNPRDPELERAFPVLWAEFEWFAKVLREGRARRTV